MALLKGKKAPIVQLLRDLRNTAGRNKHGCFLVEGTELVRRALDFDAGVEHLVLAESLVNEAEGRYLGDLAAAAGVPVDSCSAGLLAQALGATKPLPDCVAVLKRKTISLSEAFREKTGLVLMTEHCENADNLGMILRTADAAGTAAVILAADTIDPFNRRTIRGSRGAAFSMPVCIAGPADTVVRAATAAGYRAIASSANSERDYLDEDYRGAVLIVIGNEHTGISPAVREHAASVVRIPMRGRINSLNVASAAGILLYEALRQRPPQRDTATLP